ncbi:MAG: UpxY family transcription antiterminator [Agriterribacter sp.]
MKSEEKKWYAIYTKPRWEKKVSILLTNKGIQSYCPLTKIRKRWSDRYKLVHEPLFKSYVFVKIEETEMQKIKYIPGVVNFVYWNNKPAIVREEEIIKIKEFLSEYDSVEVELVNVSIDQRVRILKGLFKNEEGTISYLGKNKIQLTLHSLGLKLLINRKSGMRSPS